MRWTCAEIGILMKTYPQHGIKAVLQALPNHSRRDIEGMIRKIELRRVFAPKLLPINAANLRRCLLAQDYFIRRDLSRPRTTSPTGSP